MTLTAIQFADERHLNDLISVQGQLTLSKIMTPRREFICCAADEPAQSAMERIPTIFDAVPVIDSTDPNDTSAPIIGLLHRDRLPFRNRTVRAADCADVDSITKAHPVDRNLLVYIRSLSGQAVEFVMDGADVIGLVTPYDLERLPVRTALFALIIDVERYMGDLISARFPDSSVWETLIDRSLRSELKTGLARARSRNSSGHAILSVGFNVKLDLLGQCFDDRHETAWVCAERDEIRIMRNNVAHGSPFSDVLELPKEVRNLIQLRSLILGRLLELRGSD